jgi:hypothetical protein
MGSGVAVIAVGLIVDRQLVGWDAPVKQATFALLTGRDHMLAQLYLNVAVGGAATTLPWVAMVDAGHQMSGLTA